MTTGTTDRPRTPTRPAGAGELFQYFRDGQSRSKTELSALTGHARSTIGTRIDALMAAGFLVPLAESASTGGRPPNSFAFNAGARVVLGVDLGATHARLGISDLSGEILAQSEDSIDIEAGPAEVLGWVAQSGRRLLASTGRPAADLAAVGIGLPGPVEHSTGRPVNPPIMPGWDGVDVPAILTGHLGVPVLVDNDVNTMALGEYRAAWPELQDLLFLKVATGIGAGIIMDGDLRRGAQGAAGDFGHISAGASLTVPCRCGNTGCLEAVAGAGAIAFALRGIDIEAHTSADVVALARAGNLAARHAIRDSGRLIGGVLASAVSMINPSVIVIGGTLADAEDHLIAGIREVVYQRSLPLATQHLRIATSRTGSRAGILGTSFLAIDHLLSPEAVELAVA